METLEQPTEQRVKRVLSPEQKLRMQAGRKKKPKDEVITTPIVLSKDSKIKIFGKVDRDKAGNIRSEYPAFYFTEQKENLIETISQMERGLEEGAIPDGKARVNFREALRKKKERLADIEESTPKIEGKERDILKKMREEFSEELKESHPKRVDGERGLVDAHEEMRRMTEPCVKIKSQEAAELAKEFEIKISDNGMITRNQMDKMFKISSKLLGESTDVEYLRR